MGSYFKLNWFNQPALWSRLGTANVFTKGNNTTNSIESFHKTLKRTLPGIQRLDKIIEGLLTLSWSRIQNDTMSSTLLSVKTDIRHVDQRITERLSRLTPRAGSLVEEQLQLANPINITIVQVPTLSN